MLAFGLTRGDVFAETPSAGLELFDGSYMEPTEIAVARAIHRVIPQDLSQTDSFILLGERRGHEVEPELPLRHFVLISGKHEKTKIECEEGAILRILNRQSGQSGFSVARCQKARTQLVEIVKSGPTTMEWLRSQLAKSFEINEAELKNAGMYYARKTYADAEVHYMPQPLGSHGMSVAPVAIIVDATAAWVVYARLEKYCAQSDARVGSGQRLCTQPDEVLAEIAREVRSALPAQ